MKVKVTQDMTRLVSLIKVIQDQLLKLKVIQDQLLKLKVIQDQVLEFEVIQDIAQEVEVIQHMAQEVTVKVMALMLVAVILKEQVPIQAPMVTCHSLTPVPKQQDLHQVSFHHGALTLHLSSWRT